MNQLLRNIKAITPIWTGTDDEKWVVFNDVSHKRAYFKPADQSRNQFMTEEGFFTDLVKLKEISLL